jgi:hypothetical protein
MSEEARLKDRWENRPGWQLSRWYTVEYDENSVAWLIADTKDRICLVHGMQIDVAQIAVVRPERHDQEASPRPQKKKRSKKAIP